MEIYKHNRLCPKCGQDMIRNAFRAQGDRISYEISKTDIAKEELIHRTCQNCRWSWDERPQNQGDKPSVSTG